MVVLRTSTDCSTSSHFETQLQTLLGVQLLLEKQTYFFSKVLQFEEGSSTLHLSLDEGGRGYLEKGEGLHTYPVCAVHTHVALCPGSWWAKSLGTRLAHIVYLHIATAEVVVTETERERKRGREEERREERGERRGERREGREEGRVEEREGQ